MIQNQCIVSKKKILYIDSNSSRRVISINSWIISNSSSSLILSPGPREFLQLSFVNYMMLSLKKKFRVLCIQLCHTYTYDLTIDSIQKNHTGKTVIKVYFLNLKEM